MVFEGGYELNENRRGEGGVLAMYLHGGVDDIETKEELKSLLRQSPRSVHFYCTNLVGTSWSGPVAEMPRHAILSIFGPDPHRDRQWHAVITCGHDGFQVK